MSNVSRAELAPLVDDLTRVFGTRLLSLVAYGPPTRQPAATLAIVETLTSDDLTSCAAHASAWHRSGVATPLLLPQGEFARSADAFPIEYLEMQESAAVLHGVDPFARWGGAQMDDVRRACEVQARSHLLHLREDYLECGGRPRDVVALVAESAPGFVVLLRRMARLEGERDGGREALTRFAATRGLDARVVGDLLTLADPAAAPAVDGARLFPAYLGTVEQIVRLIDRWGASNAAGGAAERGVDRL